MGFFDAVVLFFAMVFGVAGLAIIADHRQRMARIREEARARSQHDFAGALEALRREVGELRDTATQYDVSIDNALRRIEGRVGSLEQRVGQVEQLTGSVRLGQG